MEGCDSVFSWFFEYFIAFYCFFCIVFCWQKQLSTKLTSFYLAEAVKFLFTILLVIAFFKWFEITNFLLFFSGFMVALILNNLLPFCLDKTASILLFFIQGIYYVRTNLD
ncbi:ATP synthase subunit I [Haemophilus pittmaniae]